MLKVIANQFVTMKSVVDRTTNVLTMTNVFRDHVLMPVRLIDAVLMHNVCRNNIVVYAHARQAILETHTLNVLQYQNIRSQLHQLIVILTMIVHSIEHVATNDV